MQRLQHGTLHLELPDGQVLQLGSGQHPHASMCLHNWQVFAAVLRSGDIGLAEGYIAQDWSTPHLADLLRLLMENRHALESLVYGGWWGRLAYRLRHLLNRNTRANSQKNIHAHYDLGNAFYELWLDDTMNYSSAWFEGDAGGDMRVAQHAKVRRALRMAGVQAGDRVLEIGCGWGALAEMATTEFGASLTGVTLSTEQLAFAQKRMVQQGVAEHADLRLQDYRDNKEQFDHVVSIEMFEAVGERWWPTYFRTVANALKPEGRAVIQSITIRDDLFAAYRKGTDFIQQYVFPGGMLPSRAAFRSAAARQGLAVRNEYAFGLDYARTLAEWRVAFEARWPEIQKLGFDETFRRLWRMYLCYCEAGFRAGSIDVVQFELAHR